MSVKLIQEPMIFPYVVFTNVDGKGFIIERSRITHSETYCYRDGNTGQEVLDASKTFVNFKSPNHKSKGSLHAVVDMPLEVFREAVLKAAYLPIVCKDEDQADTTR